MKKWEDMTDQELLADLDKSEKKLWQEALPGTPAFMAAGVRVMALDRLRRGIKSGNRREALDTFDREYRELVHEGYKEEEEES